jgi:hypothetical protein
VPFLSPSLSPYIYIDIDRLIDRSI